MPFMNFKIVNAKNFKMDLFIIYSLRFQSLGGTQRYKRSLLKNPRAIKLKIQEKHMTSTSWATKVLMNINEY